MKSLQDKFYHDWNKIAIQAKPQMEADNEASSVQMYFYKGNPCLINLIRDAHNQQIVDSIHLWSCGRMNCFLTYSLLCSVISAKSCPLVLLHAFILKKNITMGSFHIRSTNFWPFLRWPPPICFKFGTFVDNYYTNKNANFRLCMPSGFLRYDLDKFGKKVVFRSDATY